MERGGDGIKGARYSCLLAVASLVFAILGGCGQPADKMFAKAEKALHDGLYNEAYYSFREIVENYPKDERADEALFTSAEISLLFLNNVSMAISLFTDLVDRYPTSPYYLKAKRHLAEIYAKPYQDCSKSVDEYQYLIEVEEKPERRAEYQYAIAECYFRNDEFQRALFEYRAVAQGYPGSGLAEDALFQLANIYYILGNYEGAMRQYDELANRYPRGKHITYAIVGKASSLEELGRYKDALAQYEKLLKYDKMKMFAKNSLERINSRLAKK